MSSPLVSVVLPAHNGRRYLGESIASVLAQRFTDFELLICDDGSTDDTRAIAAATGDARVCVLANARNLGLFPTLNRLVGEARGRYIRFWAQDDRMKPHCLAAEVRFWERQPDIALSYCQRDLIDEHGHTFAPAPFDPTPEVIPPWLATQIAVYHGCLQGNIATVMTRRDVFDEVGPFADFRVSGDFDMWTRISARYPIGFVRQALIDLRHHPDQFSRSPIERATFIREDRSVVDRLLRSLPEDIREHARGFRRKQQWVWNVHFVMRCLAAGRFASARLALAEIRRDAALLPLALRWAFTANGTIRRPKPMYIAPDGATADFPHMLTTRTRI